MIRKIKYHFGQNFSSGKTFRRAKVTNFWPGDENFPRQIVSPDKVKLISQTRQVYYGPRVMSLSSELNHLINHLITRCDFRKTPIMFWYYCGKIENVISFNEMLKLAYNKEK